MFQIALVIFRECLEISMVLGIICAATRSIRHSIFYITGGVMVGILAASILAFFITKLTFSFSGFGEELFNVAIILLTVLVVGATAIWIKKYASSMPDKMNYLTARIEQGLAHKIILTSVVASIIFREVTEIVLFVHALASAYELTPTDYIFGFISGISMGGACALIIYYGLSKIAIKYLFRISFLFLVFIAASLASEAAGILTSIGYIDFCNEPLWDSSWLIGDFSLVGRFLKILVGYNAHPNAIQILFYVGTILLILTCSKIGEKRKCDAKITS